MLWIVTAAAVLTPAGAQRITFYAIVIAAYTAAVYSPYRAAALLSLPVTVITIGTDEHTRIMGAMTSPPIVPTQYVPLLILIPLIFAANGMRTWKLRTAASQDRVSALERERAEELRRATEQERARISRELHDVVTHNVSMMTIQAGAARKVMDLAPDEAREALLAVEAAGRSALAELRHTMGLLTMNDPQDPDRPTAPDLTPQPGLDQLDSLVDRMRHTGVPVTLTTSGTPRDVPSGIGLTVYRVVQEALTNIVKHAHGAQAKVVVDYADDHLKVEVADTGGAPSATAATGKRPRPARPARAPVRLRRRPAHRAPADRRLPRQGPHPAASGCCGDRVSAPLRVVVADDQALVRTGFRLILLADGIDVVAEAADGEEAVEAVARTGPDVVLMDIRMPGLDGLEATRRILTGAPDEPRVIMLTTFDLDDLVYAALAAGASGFLLKDVTPEHLVAAVRLVRTGDALLAPAITRRLVERYALTGAAPAPDSSPHRDLEVLTQRELEVLRLLAQGLSNAELAERLFLSETTVKTHVGRILAKLRLRDRVQAVVTAYETGLVSPKTAG